MTKKNGKRLRVNGKRLRVMDTLTDEYYVLRYGSRKSPMSADCWYSGDPKNPTYSVDDARCWGSESVVKDFVKEHKGLFDQPMSIQLVKTTIELLPVASLKG